jgi:hypothetical protein
MVMIWWSLRCRVLINAIVNDLNDLNTKHVRDKERVQMVKEDESTILDGLGVRS